MLVDLGQVAEEGLPAKDILERSRAAARLGEVGSARGTASVGQHAACALDVLDLSRSHSLVELGGALDRLLQVLVRGVEGEDDLALCALADSAHLAERLTENLGARQAF